MVFNEEKHSGDIIASADWNAFVDYTEAISGVAYWSSGQVKAVSGAFWSHSSNADIHFPSSAIRAWLDGVYALSGVTSEVSSQVHLVSGLSSDDSIYHDGTETYLYLSDVPQKVLASGNKYWSAYLSSQSLGALAFKDTVDISDDTNLSVQTPIKLTNDTLEIELASASVTGALKASDWNIFNSKQDSYNHGVLSNGIGINSFSVGISGADATVSVSFGKTNTTVASGSHLHDSRYYTETESDSLFYPSSAGSLLNSSLYNHSSNKDIHYPSSQIRPWLDSVYMPSQQLYISSMADVDYNPSNLEDGKVLTWNATIGKWSSQAISGGSGGAPQDAKYVVTQFHAELTNEVHASSLAGSYINWNSADIRYDLASGSLKSWYDTIYAPSSLFNSHRLDASAHHSRYTDEEAQDAVGNILDDGTQGEVIFTYDDTTPKIYATVQDGEIDHNQLANTHNLTTDIDHGSISGLGDDDHTQYYNQSRISKISSNAVSGQLAKAWLDASGSKYDTAYQHSQTVTGNPHNIDLNDIGETKGNFTATSPLSLDNTRQVLGGALNISIQQATSTTDGYLSSSDWNTFNNKQDSITFGTLSNGTGIESFSAGISGSNATISVAFGKTDSTVASGSHIHDDRYYTESEADSNFFPSSLGHSHINNTSNPHNVTYSQVGAIQDASNTVKDTHIDWGTGANQVSLDDVPDGSTYARLTVTQKTDLTDGGDSSLHYHSADRDLSNATGTLTISHGGTNNTSYTTGKFIAYDGTKLASTAYDNSSFASASHTHNASDITAGTLLHERGGLEADVSAYNGLVKIAGGTTSYITDNSANWDTAYTHSQTTTGNPHSISVDDLTDTNISSPGSGQLLTYDGSNWVNRTPPMTFSIANIKISAQQNLNLTRFTCPAGKKVYVLQAAACASGGSSIADLFIEILSGSTSVYKTSSSTLQIGNPLAVADGGNIEIRFAYSGGNASGIVYGTGFMNIGVW